MPTPRPPTPTFDASQFVTPTPEAFPPPTPEGGDTLLDLGIVATSETTPRQITLETTDGVTLAGTYYPPIQAPAPALLLLHMLGSDRQVWQTFAQLTQAEGYAILAIDLRGHGESGGTQDVAAMDADVEAALAWLTAKEEIDSNRVGIIGASIGANLALRAGADDETIKSVALLSPGLDYRGLTTTPAITTWPSARWTTSCPTARRS